MNQIEFETQLKKEFNALDNQIQQFEIYNSTNSLCNAILFRVAS